MSYSPNHSATSAATTAAAQRRYFGKYRGQVINNIDPEFRGRVLFSATLGNTPIQNWAEACTPLAGPTSGFYAIPTVGAGVWVEFEEGDLDRPIWTGCWWRATDLPVLLNPDTPPATQATAPFAVVLRCGLGRVKLDATGVTVDTPTTPGVSVKVTPALIEVKFRGNSIRITDASVMINNTNLVVLP